MKETLQLSSTSLVYSPAGYTSSNGQVRWGYFGSSGTIRASPSIMSANFPIMKPSCGSRTHTCWFSISSFTLKYRNVRSHGRNNTHFAIVIILISLQESCITRLKNSFRTSCNSDEIQLNYLWEIYSLVYPKTLSFSLVDSLINLKSTKMLRRFEIII